MEVRTGAPTRLFEILPEKGWEAFGRANGVLLRRGTRRVLLRGHGGEVVPGFIIEHLFPAVRAYCRSGFVYPITAEVDPTWVCRSVTNCGGHCFSMSYRAGHLYSMDARLLGEFVRSFASAGGKVVRWDGGGEPLVHRAIRDGSLVATCAELGLAQTILTSGDLLAGANWDAYIDANLYLRVSLNAATDVTHARFLGIPDRLTTILATLEGYAARKANSPTGRSTPLGATYLLSHLNWHELADCAAMAKGVGVNHFSVRRVLGPPALRPEPIDEAALDEQFERASALEDDSFQTFLPWRHVSEPDVPAHEIPAERCWQSLFKLVLEPTADRSRLGLNLCGRYRGGGVGQLRQIPPMMLGFEELRDFEATWRHWLLEHDRRELLMTCPSCIDRGFIMLVDRLIRSLCFVGTDDAVEASYVRIDGDRDYCEWTEPEGNRE